MSAGGTMYREAAEAPRVVREQLEVNAPLMQELGALLRQWSPRAVITCARGSSDHAATFARYLIETRARVLTGSAAPSVSSLYQVQTDHRDVVFLAISQSGQSPDLVAAARNAARRGARVVTLCNVMDSPLARLAHHAVPLCAGTETSIAATKSYIASLSAIVHLLAAWTSDTELMSALAQAPALLERAWGRDWERAVPVLAGAASAYVVGRGLGLAVAQEAALKLKETAGLHAEAFSAAELRHGPMALIRRGFPVLMLCQRDQSRDGMERLAAELIERGAAVACAGAGVAGATTLGTVGAHPVIEPMLMIQSFYRLAAALAAARGVDPDTPPHLNKVTETL